MCGVMAKLLFMNDLYDVFKKRRPVELVFKRAFGFVHIDRRMRCGPWGYEIWISPYRHIGRVGRQGHRNRPWAWGSWPWVGTRLSLELWRRQVRRIGEPVPIHRTSGIWADLQSFGSGLRSRGCSAGSCTHK